MENKITSKEYIQKSMKLFNENKYDESINMATQALEVDANCLEARVWCGNVIKHIYTGDIEDKCFIDNSDKCLLNALVFYINSLNQIVKTYGVSDKEKIHCIFREYNDCSDILTSVKEMLQIKYPRVTIKPLDYLVSLASIIKSNRNDSLDNDNAASKCLEDALNKTINEEENGNE